MPALSALSAQAGGYDAIVAAASRKYGVPESYIRSVMQVESSGRPDAVSPKGAAGLMQLMLPTYQEIAKREGLGPDRFNPTNNINAGTAYMRQMYDQFGNWGDAFGAYNAGPGRWADVKAGRANAPRETQAYIPKVQAAGGTDQGAGMNFGDVLNKYAGTMRPSAALTEEQLLEQTRGGSLPGQVGGGRSLLDVDSGNNWLEGLGGLLGEGQTGSQPPGPSISPLQYQLAGAGNAVGQLAGVTNRRVGIGELLGALGGGLTQGAAAGQQAQRQKRADQREERGEQFNNLYRGAMAAKALQPDRLNLGDRFKVAGKRIFDAATQQWIDDPNAAQEPGGPFPSEGLPSQLLNTYYTLEQKRVNGGLNPQEQLLYDLTAQQLGKPRLVPGPDGIVREVTPPPLPTLPNAGGGAPPVAAPPPGPDLLGINTPPPGGAPPAPPPAQTATVTPSGSRVTEVVSARPKDLPQTVQNNLLTNISGLRAVENAITATKKAPDATGIVAGGLNMVPGGIVNKVMPGGTEARAAISDIGSLKIHDRSGAAVTAAEFPRLAPFVPLVSDDENTVQIKLKRFNEELTNEIRDQATMYGVDQGYRGNPILSQFLKTGRAPRYEAPMSGVDGGGGSGKAAGMSDDDLSRMLGLGR